MPSRPPDSTPSTTPGSGALAPLLLISLALLSAAAPLGTDMYLASMLQMAADLHTSAPVVQLTLSAFMVGLGLGQLLIGPISDGLGRRRPMIVGTVVFLVTSVCVALAPTIQILIGLRFVMGMAGGTGIVLSRAVVADLARENGAARAFALLMAIQGLAPVIGPVLGGVLSGLIGWRGIFALLAVFNLFMTLAAVFVVPESLPVERRSASGPSRMLRDARQILANRRFVGYAVIFAVGFGVMFSYISASPFVLQGQYGLDRIHYALTFAGNAILMATVSLVSTRLVGRVQVRHLLAAGLVLMVVGVGGLLVCGAFGAPLAAVVALLAVTVSGIALSLGNSTALAVGALGGRAAGTGSGIMGAAQFLVAGLVSPLVGFGQIPVRSMSLVMAACLVVTLGVGLPLSRPQRNPA